ncbi:transmembrane and coiled-coil domain protein 3 isoform 2-T2 [Clarias gariepinus]|uniref:transmembrane and coiled-coil domain protein 3 isoform X2 n=1 Tax=Clarias gariepinus TaxID=13013 RepID=UPI00234D9AA2|nr:transmembrane and coiled-coil domain protein 3 isoform X2 [Clarias gariepinus]
MSERAAEGIILPGIMQRGGSDLCLELESDTAVRDGARPRLGLDSLQQKMLKVTEQLRIEQALRDENVAEYLKLIDTADKQQSSRIKHVFEKKNQKSAQSIAQLQRKLEQYHRKIKECDTAASANGTKQAQTPGKEVKEAKEASRDSLKDCVKETGAKAIGRNQHLDKVKTVGPGVSLSPPFFFNKSRGFASLIRNKFGSADNIAHLKSTMETGGGLRAEGAGRALSGSATLTSKPKYPSDDECSTGTSASAESSGHGVQPEVVQVESGSRLSEALEEVRELKESQGHLTEDIESLRSQAKRNYGFISQMLQEERYRCERLEDQLNDLTELHQNETTNLKQELASIEEKVAYQAYERARDMQEALEACQTRLSKLELQQQQQQLVQLESADAKVLLGKCINIMLAIATVILVCVSTAAKFTAPLLRSRLHVLATLACVCLLALGWSHWDQVQYVVEQILLTR